MQKNLTFLTINVVTGKKKIFQNTDYFKALTLLPPPTFSFSQEQMSISMETTARTEDVRTHMDFKIFFNDATRLLGLLSDAWSYQSL